MAILGITNRTENWKTAEVFCGLREEGRVNLVRKLSNCESSTDDIKLELFWYGMRDCHTKWTKEDTAKSYCRIFRTLRDDILRYPKLKACKPHIYNASNMSTLYSNLMHTEIDIVLETSDHLFIGEAKYESGLGTDGENVLVHQLIREYVMARVLVDLTNKKKKIVPFVVVNENKLDSIKNTGQVGFMIDQDPSWLKECNILSWNEIKSLGQ